MIWNRRLRTRVSFLSLDTAQNDYGETIEDFNLVKNTWAEVITSDKEKTILSDGDNVESQKSFRVRYSKTITCAKFIECDGVKYEIQSIENPNQLNKELIISAISYL